MNAGELNCRVKLERLVKVGDDSGGYEEHYEERIIASTMAEWLRLMEPVAYGALKLKPWEFGRLTVAEFRQLVEGYEWRQKQRRISLAYMDVFLSLHCLL